jgi:hypothetical protein
MWRIFGGALLIVAGIAAFIEASSHAPELQSRCRTGGASAEEVGCPIENYVRVHVGLSQTAYDLLRIGGWALVIFGTLLLVVGLIAYARRRDGGAA